MSLSWRLTGMSCASHLLNPHIAHSFDVKPFEKMLPHCSWQISVTPVSFPALPEWSCIYQSTVLRNLTTTRHAKITGACTGRNQSAGWPRTCIFQNLCTCMMTTQINRFFVCCPSGRFPRNVRYFSINTYDTRGLSVQTITDFQIRPINGACQDKQPTNQWIDT